ncbi:MAG: metallophosphoesterase [Bryobacteraceae bacterium]
MSSPPKITLAIASDLHAHSNHPVSPSHLNTSAPEGVANQHPITGLLTLIEKEHLTATALLSPGDLGHQADPQGIQYSWNALKRLSVALGAEFYTATAGNHDIDSRYQGNDHAPEHILKSLTPSFPLGDDRFDDRYWARAYVIKDTNPFRLVLLNSSAYHGNTPTEKNHGRIDKQTLEDLRKDLTNRGKREINILLCHHHPHQHSELGLGEDDVMKQGQLLLDVLGSGQHGRWLVIHGHKHHPKMSYAAGGGGSAIVFAAGSLCSTLYPELQTVARNQFYLVTIDPAKCSGGLVGRVQAWDWASGIGWIQGRDNSGLPAHSGFGLRADPSLVAKRLAEIVDASPTPIPWVTLTQNYSDILYALPQDLNRIEVELSETYKIQITKIGSVPHEIGRSL